MVKTGESERFSELSYKSKVSYYKTDSCEGCPLREMCYKGDQDRKIEINHTLRTFKEKVRQKLLSEEGIRLRKNKAIEPEEVFGQLKSNNRFNRFRPRTLPKVNVEFGLATISA